MANWSNPTLSSLYTDFLNELKARDTDLALQFDGVTVSNLATGTIRWNSTANRWQKWTGSAWGELTSTYALTGLSTTGNASIGGTLSVTGATALAAATAATPATGDNSTAVATTAWVRNQAFATLASPALTGTPTAPTAATGTNTTQLATTAFVNNEIANDAILKTGGTLTGALVLAADPTADLEPVTRRYMEAQAFKDSVRVATTAALTVTATTSTLTNASTLTALSIDGISLSVGDRVLVKDQTSAPQNGLYVVTNAGSGSVAWVLTRAGDADTWNDLVGSLVVVEEGAVNNDNVYVANIARGGTLGTTPIPWRVASNLQLAAIGDLATTGLIVRTGSGTAVTRSIAVSGTGLSVSNADGLAGNPTITINGATAATANTVAVRDGAGGLAVAGLAYSGNVDTTSTGYLELPVGTTAQRPGSAATGMLRFNSTLGQFEGYSGSTWGSIGGGATGGGADQVFHENSQTVTTDYTLSTGKNAVSAGPITINSGVTVTIPTDANWSIV